MLSVGGRGASLVNTKALQRSLYSIRKRSYLHSGGTDRPCGCSICCITKASLCSCKSNNWIVRPVRFNASPGTRPAHFLHGNSRPHTNIIRQKQLEIGKEDLIHLPYRPELAPSKYLMLFSLSSALPYIPIFNEYDLNQCKDDLFASKLKRLIVNAFKICPKNDKK